MTQNQKTRKPETPRAFKRNQGQAIASSYRRNPCILHLHFPKTSAFSMLSVKVASFSECWSGLFPQKRGHVEQTIIFANQKRATIFQTPSGNRFAQISRGLTGRKSSQGSTGTRVKFSHRPRVHYADRKQKSRRSDRNSSIS